MYGAYFVCLSLLFYLMKPAIGDPICSELFGSPTYNDCEELATELTGGWPGEEPRPDRRLHLFTVPDVAIPSWVAPHSRNRRVNLPKFASEGPGCEMSLMPLWRSNGQVSVDVGYYYPMSRPAQEINTQCVRSKEQGGFTKVGATRSLVLAFYAPNSPFDRVVQQWLKTDQVSCQDAVAREHGSGKTSEDTPNESCEEDDVFQKFLEAIGDFSDLEEPEAPTAPAPPMCGESCWGPVNLCGASDGCRCIADSFQGVGSRYYTGICKPSNFAFDGRRLHETLTNGTDLVHVASNFTLTANRSAGIQEIAPPACPCNCTYVSLACCDAPSGVVYEAVDLKLGILEPSQCPDSTNSMSHFSHK